MCVLTDIISRKLIIFLGRSFRIEVVRTLLHRNAATSHWTQARYQQRALSLRCPIRFSSCAGHLLGYAPLFQFSTRSDIPTRGIKDYAALIHQVVRVFRSGGMVLLVDADYRLYDPNGQVRDPHLSSQFDQLWLSFLNHTPSIPEHRNRSRCGLQFLDLVESPSRL
jgi:hypothetical protein